MATRNPHQPNALTIDDFQPGKFIVLHRVENRRLSPSSPVRLVDIERRRVRVETAPNYPYGEQNPPFVRLIDTIFGAVEFSLYGLGVVPGIAGIWDRDYYCTDDTR